MHRQRLCLGSKPIAFSFRIRKKYCWCEHFTRYFCQYCYCSISRMILLYFWQNYCSTALFYMSLLLGQNELVQQILRYFVILDSKAADLAFLPMTEEIACPSAQAGLITELLRYASSCRYAAVSGMNIAFAPLSAKLVCWNNQITVENEVLNFLKCLSWSPVNLWILYFHSLRILPRSLETCVFFTRQTSEMSFSGVGDYWLECGRWLSSTSQVLLLVFKWLLTKFGYNVTWEASELHHDNEVDLIQKKWRWFHEHLQNR